MRYLLDTTAFSDLMREHPKVDAHLADHYAMTKVTRERRGLALDENDLWIAGAALALGAVLVSRDSDFAGIDGLKVQDWTA